MEDNKKQEERNFELRSEKVRSIVGQIPSSLIRYGITAIAFVLIALFAVAYFLPYKKVYSGVAIIHEVNNNRIDSTDVVIMVKFENKSPKEISRQLMYLQQANGLISGEMLST